MVVESGSVVIEVGSEKFIECLSIRTETRKGEC